jgi:hypothetical protein
MGISKIIIKLNLIEERKKSIKFVQRKKYNNITPNRKYSKIPI